MALPNPVEPTTYEVQAGDSLWEIAQQHYGHGNEWKAIYHLNEGRIGPNSDLIHPGQWLIIPGRYVVATGDTWETIQKRLALNVVDITLYRENLHVILESNPHFTPGEILYIGTGGGIGDHE